MRENRLSFIGVLVVVAVAIGPVGARAGQPAESRSGGRTGSGHELLEDCRRYFTFLGRTGAGRAETFDEDPFGMGYCAGLVRGVARSVDAFHPGLECRLGDYTFHHTIRAVVRYLEARPESLDEPDSRLVLRAIQLQGLCTARP